MAHSLLGMGAELLTKLKSPQTISSLWEKVRKSGKINSYEKYILTLDLLYLLGTIFDGVDERQIASALELAYFDAQAEGFQYICALNSETLPYDFSETFKTEFDKHVVIIFTDASDDGGLLGIRF